MAWSLTTQASSMVVEQYGQSGKPQYNTGG